MLDTEYRFFVDNKDILFRDYPNKFVIIIGTDIVASFDTFEEAYFNAIKTYQEGTFLIDQCTGGNQATGIPFKSNILDGN